MNLNCENILRMLVEELNRAKRLHPGYPRDPIHAAAIVSEEAGELVRAANRVCYENADPMELVDEAIQVGAMAIRFLENYKNLNLKD